MPPEPQVATTSESAGGPGLESAAANERLRLISTRPDGVDTQSRERNRPSPFVSAGKKNEHPAGADRTEMLERLLSFERELRVVQSISELKYCLANELLQLSQARQVFQLKLGGGTKPAARVETVSNLSSIDKNAPALISLEKEFERAIQDSQRRPLDENQTPFAFIFKPPPREAGGVVVSERAVLMLLNNRRGKPHAALVLVGGENSFDSEMALLERVREAAQHAWLALKPRSGYAISNRIKKSLITASLACAVFAMFIPVSLTTLAPVEIVAKDAEVVAAPIEGVVERILVDENTRVEAGAPLLQYVDTELSANLKIARQKLAVALAHLRTTQQKSFGAGDGRRDLLTTKAELKLAQAELNYAEAQFSKAIVRAPRDGTVIFDRKSKWQGRPVSLGEKIMEIADTNAIEARVDLAVDDAILISENARVQLFLDANPLKAIEARISTSSYRAKPDVSNQLVYELYSDLLPDDERKPRIGARGTAQVFGDRVTLAFYLFRRPFAAIRQWIGA